MTQPIQKWIFTLYERHHLRNWFYTLAFAIFLPTGFRFAILAWEYGDWFDKPLSIIAGLAIGITAVVTLVRIWSVPPVQTIEVVLPAPSPENLEPPSLASEIQAAAMRQAAQNREIARGAAALGPTHRWPFPR